MTHTQNEFDSYVEFLNIKKRQDAISLKKRAYDKIVKVINSSTTLGHYLSCKNMIELYRSKFGNSSMLDLRLAMKIKGFL